MSTSDLSTSTPILSALYIYPIKSAGTGVPLQHSEIGPRGLTHDRRWMVIDAEGKPVTQREFSKMRLMEVSLTDAGPGVTAPNMPVLAVPWQPLGDRRAVNMWGDPLSGAGVSAEATDWISSYLGGDFDLVYLPDDSERWQPASKPFGSLLSFVDGNPFHLISEASLANFNRHLDRPVSYAEFRPNLVISGGEAYAEDFWRRVRIGPAGSDEMAEPDAVAFEVVESCARCVILNVMPDGTRGAEALRTLTRVRRDGKAAIFGQHLVQDAPYGQRTGQIRVGDTVEVVEVAETVNPVYL